MERGERGDYGQDKELIPLIAPGVRGCSPT